MRNKIVYQSQAKSCGYSCVKMALIHSSNRSDFAYAPEPIVDKQAPSLAELIKYAYSLGLTLEAFKVRDSKEILKNRDFPILVCVYEKGLSHMLYIYKRKRRSFLAFDPSVGKREISFSSFESMFELKYLRPTSYEDISPKYNKKRPFSVLLNFVHCLCSFLPTLLLFISIYLLGSTSNYLPVSLAFMSAGLLFLLLSKMESKAMMMKFDKLYLNKVDDESTYKRKEKFFHYNQYKAALFSSRPSFILHLIEIFSILILFSFNNPYSLIALSSSLLFAVSIHLLFNSKDNIYQEDVASLEYEYYSRINSKEDRLVLLNKISKSGDKYMSLLMGKEAITFAFTSAISVLLTLINGIINIESFLSNFLMNYLMIQLTSNCLLSFSSLSKKNKEEAYFSFYFL
ncbi:MAG: cysteine peptidase family C39 domain-containing protein [Mollicutes bacterium]|nr:cysteine peptidase family C39 domain-containing protein [Mollicutes bacterium]